MITGSCWQVASLTGSASEILSEIMCFLWLEQRQLDFMTFMFSRSSVHVGQSQIRGFFQSDGGLATVHIGDPGLLPRVAAAMAGARDPRKMARALGFGAHPSLAEVSSRDDVLFWKVVYHADAQTLYNHHDLDLSAARATDSALQGEQHDNRWEAVEEEPSEESYWKTLKTEAAQAHLLFHLQEQSTPAVEAQEDSGSSVSVAMMISFRISATLSRALHFLPTLLRRTTREACLVHIQQLSTVK